MKKTGSDGLKGVVGNIRVSWFLLFLPKETSILIMSFKAFSAEGWPVASSKAWCGLILACSIQEAVTEAAKQCGHGIEVLKGE